MDVNDDAVVVKGGKGPEANDYAKFPGNGPSEGILVEDCLFKSVCHSCLTLGSECPAVTNVVMRNCRLEGPGFFVNVKMRDDTPQDYSGILVETCRGRCRKLFNCRAWTQFSAVKDGGEPSRSRLSNFTMRGNKVAAAKPSDTFDDRSFISFSNCRMEDASGIMQAQ
jgi:polygalacturonase